MEYKNIGCGRRRFFNLFAPLLRKPSGYRRFCGGESFFPGHLGETIATQLRMYETTNTSTRIDEVHYVLAQIQQIMCCTNVQARAHIRGAVRVCVCVTRPRTHTNTRRIMSEASRMHMRVRGNRADRTNVLAQSRCFPCT